MIYRLKGSRCITICDAVGTQNCQPLNLFLFKGSLKCFIKKARSHNFVTELGLSLHLNRVGHLSRLC